MNRLYLDFETRSKIDLTKVGAWRYASDPSTDITCMAFTFDTIPVQLFTRPQVKNYNHSLPHMLQSLDAKIVAHSVQFEYSIYHFILHKRYGWPSLLDPKRWDCTMARALMCGLPPSLEGVALALNVPHKKDMEGRRAMFATCKPQKDGTWNEDPATLNTLYKYCANDVETERAVDKVLPELPKSERKIFELDLVMNRRGVAIDIQSATYAVEIAARLTDELNAKLRDLTAGAVDKATQMASMKRWIAAQGVTIPITKEVDENGNEVDKETLDKEAVSSILQDKKTPEIVRSVVGIRQQVGKSSVAKFSAMLNAACQDGRIRGTLQYHGAHTGRWAGRIIQPQNFAQGYSTEAEQETAIALMAEPSLFASVFKEKGMQTLSDSLRGMIVPAPGKIFLGADYNAIEARIVFWLAGETGALDMYARGESPYLKMGELIYGWPISKKANPLEYNLAKMTVLGAGFGMGWVKFQGQAATRGFTIADDLAKLAIRAYRKFYAKVPAMWYAMEKAAVQAVLNPECTIICADARIVWQYNRQFLVCRLPSGRLLRYFRPEVVATETEFGEKQELRYWTAADKGAIKTECNGMLGQYRTWGGELFENTVQAIARDILCAGLLNTEAAGYSSCLTIHDEILAEVPLNFGSMEEFIRLMCQIPSWAAGCPINAEGYSAKRYHK